MAGTGSSREKCGLSRGSLFLSASERRPPPRKGVFLQSDWSKLSKKRQKLVLSLATQGIKALYSTPGFRGLIVLQALSA